MEIERDQSNGCAILRVQGEIVLEVLHQLKHEFHRCITDEEYYVALNLEHVTALSSSGVGAIMGFSRELNELGGQLILASVAPVAEYVIELLRLRELFTLAASEAEAIDLLNASRG